MTKTTSGGKVERKPDLERLDSLNVATKQSAEVGGSSVWMTETWKGSLNLASKSEMSRQESEALLVKLGVDGSVTINQARRNAGLDLLPLAPANDNHQIAASLAA